MTATVAAAAAENSISSSCNIENVGDNENNNAGELVLCYNKGCGKRFNPRENNPDSCHFHPGPPYFHDAYKIWKCCEKKSTDFSTWLSYPGCTRGPHNGEKPPEDAPKVAAMKEIRPEKEDEVIVWNGLNKPAERPVTKRETVTLGVQMNEGAKKALDEEMRKRIAGGDSVPENGGAAFPSEKLFGTTCKNNTCKAVFTGPESDAQECVHHPGVAVFHEGMKFWSCCERKTSDFGAFMEQAGCSRGKHCWFKEERVNNVREDWFQRSGQVLISLYCKGAVPEGTRVETDGFHLEATIRHGFGAKETVRRFDLFGEIVPAESQVMISERKVELMLKQASRDAWPKLCYYDEKGKEEQSK